MVAICGDDLEGKRKDLDSRCLNTQARSFTFEPGRPVGSAQVEAGDLAVEHVKEGDALEQCKG